jgi:filamentous hemagglutinin family protein
MNHTYRVIWNEAGACFEAVAETASGKGKRSLGKRERKLRALALAAGLAAAQALAAPMGGQVSAGQGGITQSGTTTTITQTTPKLAINWQSFGIAGNETVNFVQPGASAIALNRVLGTEASQILGRLNANGQVFLLNPNGVLFGQSAQVSVGGLVASTLGMSDTDFMTGRYVLRASGNGGSVRNEGTIRAADGGSIALIGAQVSNTGTLVANLGTVALAASKQVTLDFSGDGLLKLAVDEGAVNALAHNGGLMQADGGTALLTAKAADALAGTVVNNTGVIQARTLENRGGVIKLLGGFNGGTVQVGGTLDASAPTGGDGGFVDTSGAHVKVAEGTRVSTRAAQGKTGTWLIDPADFTIAASGGDISGATLSANLANSDVTILSSSGSNAAGNGDIHVNDNVSWAANTLTLTAARDINIRAVMDATGTSALVMNTGTANGTDAGVAGGKVKVPVDPVTGFAGRVNFDRAGTGFLTINGEGYIVINTLGTEGSTDGLQSINLDGGLRYALGADIDASATAGWNGNKGASPLTGLGGVMDGLGHAISNLKLWVPTSMTGMFSVIGGTVRNLDLVNVTGNAFTGAGALASDANNATLHNLRASGTLAGPGSSVGGLVGFMSGGTLQDAHAQVAINMTSSGDMVIGGLVGEAINGATLRDVSASGAVNGGNNYDYVGGLVGRLSGGATVQNARASGAVTGRAHVGGLLGANGNADALTAGTTLTNVSASGTVNGIGRLGGQGVNGAARNVGGLVGWNFGNISQASATGAVVADGGATTTYTGVGGLVGQNYSGDITNSYATGSVTATGLTGVTQYVGGLVGHSTGALSNVYATGNVSATGDYTGGLVGRNTGAVTDARSDAVTVQGPGNYTGGLIGDHSGGAIQNARATANVTSQRQYSGGLIGRSTGADLSNVTATGSVTNTGNAVGNAGANVGGLVGRVAGGTIDQGEATGDVSGYSFVGGLVGNFEGTSLTRSRSTGAVAGDSLVSGANVGGLAGYAGGTISDVRATGNVTGRRSVGGLIGNADAQLSNAVATGNVQGLTNVGGLLGQTMGVISNVHAEGTVRATDTGNSDVGGLIGSAEATLSNAYATGRVEGAGSRVGGLIGHSVNTGGVPTSNVYATGEVVGAGGVGGLVGVTDAASVIRGAYASGAVTGTGTAVGGLIGSNSGALSDAYASGSVSGGSQVGGLIGDVVAGTVDKTYATGAVSGTSALGGLAGSASGTVINSYWDTATSGQAASAAGTGRTTAQMRQQATFAGWDVGATGGTSTVWRIYEGMTSPLLRNFLVAQNVANVNTVYNAATQAGSVAAPSGTRTGTAASGRNVGTYTAFSDQQGLDIVGGLLTITPAALTVSGVTASDKVYDGNTIAALNTGAATLSGVLGSDNVAVNLSSATGNFADKNVGNAKAVTVSGVGLLSGTDAGNYSVSSPTAVIASITPKALTVSGLTADNKVYDGNNIATLNTGAAALSGVIGLESVTVNLNGVTGSFVDKMVGNAKAVTLNGTGLLGGADAGNYSVSNPAGLVADITPKALTVSGITASDKVYDGNNTATVNISSASYAGLVSGDVLEVNATGTFGNKNVGNGKTVTLASSYTGADVSNYTITDQATTTANITPKALTVSGITASDKVYDGNNTATVNVAGASYAGLITNDDLAVTATGSFGGKNVANGKTVTLASSYTGADVGNYTITGQATTTANITPKALTVSGITASDKVYDGNNTATVNISSASYAGLITNDDLAVTATGAFADKHVGSGKSVALSSSYTGADVGNYTITSQAAATASITPAALNVTAQADSRVYDGTTASAAASVITGALYDTVASAATQTFDNKNAGSGKTLTAAGLVMNDGNGGNNYSVSYVGNNSGVITPASLSVIADNQAKQVYTPDPLLTYSTGPFATGDSAASVLSGVLQRVAGEQPGNYAINQGLLAANGNYTINYTPGSLLITAGLLPGQAAGSTGSTPYQQAKAQTPLPAPEFRPLSACIPLAGRGNCAGELPLTIVDEGMRMPALAQSTN